MIAAAHAKINLGLAVGPLRPDGRHEVVTVLQRIALADTISLEAADALCVDGFAADTLVRAALQAIADAAKVEPRWRAQIDKRIPVAGGLGGGSSDAATALILANRLLPTPLPIAQLHALAAGLGSDVPFFLTPGPKLARGSGAVLEPLHLPQDYTVVLLLPSGAHKRSTAEVYHAYRGEEGFAARAADLAALASLGASADLAAFPGNDLARSEHVGALLDTGAFRAEVSGAGPTLYGLFADAVTANAAAAALSEIGATWTTIPAW